MVDWLIDWLFDRMIIWLAKCLNGWLTDGWTVWLTDFCIFRTLCNTAHAHISSLGYLWYDWLAYWLTIWSLINWLANCLHGWLTEGLTIWLINWLAHCLNGLHVLSDGQIIWWINWLGYWSSLFSKKAHHGVASNNRPLSLLAVTSKVCKKKKF